ncbi:8779_t:CDS:2 [Paraglomus brasilianum]|uniref:8779_t:CDS:1 n=1 Tax=Paraglomus brasilianum TaxID=144538 RepID=A0A9N9AU51_9GLOM|nr:8779_t:CDS:2 [Paraglomus brasilianum]
MSAQQKNYAALAVTDHYNVQSFPEFSNHQSNDLKIIYGCEMEMLEDELPPYLFNHSPEILEKKGEIIREGEYLICPEKEIPAEILATWYTSIDPQELKKAPKIKEILSTLQRE